MSGFVASLMLMSRLIAYLKPEQFLPNAPLGMMSVVEVFYCYRNFFHLSLDACLS